MWTLKMINKRILNFLVITFLTFLTFWWTFFIFHQEFNLEIVLVVLASRFIASFLIYKDYSLSWSKVSQKTYLIKSVVYVVPFLVYALFFYGKVSFSLLASELFLYLFSINFFMYMYYFIRNKSSVDKTKQVVIF